MSTEERRKILQLVADGKISADEAANLMRTLDETAEEEIEVIEAGPNTSGERSAAPEFEEVRRRAMRWAMIPLWLSCRQLARARAVRGPSSRRRL